MAILFTLVFSTQITPVFAAAIVVNSNADNITGGNALCTLREAIANSNANGDTTGGDCIAGTGADSISFNAPMIITLALGQMVILDTTAATTINGAGTVVQGNGTGNGLTRVFHIGNDAAIDTVGRTLILNGLSVRSGGGAGLSQGTLSNFGGCILVAPNSTLTVNGGTIGGTTLATGCRATNGGGIYGDEAAIVTLDSSTILQQGQATANGGGVYIITGTLNVIGGSCIINSRATLSGGGVFLGDNAFLNLGDGSTTGFLIANRAAAGGSVYIDVNGGFTGNLGRIFNNISTGSDTGSGYQAVGNNFTRSCTNCCIVNNTSSTADAIYSVYQSTQGNDSVFNNNWWGSNWGPRIIALAGTSSDASWGDSIGPGTGVSGQGVDVGLTDSNPAPGGQSMPQVTSPMYLTAGPSDCSNDICTSPSSVDPSARACSATKG